MSSARAPSEQATDFQVQALDLRKNIAAALVVCQPNGRLLSPLSRPSGLCNLLTSQDYIGALNGLR